MSLPATLPKNAPLPETYERAKAALSECQRVDECKDWADKAQALASYARQADDKTLEKLAMRIRARAIRRAGELLKTFNKPGTRTDIKPRVATGPRSQREAAKSAGMSKRQEKTAVRVANVPEDEFEDAVESKRPPTVGALAKRGKHSRPEPKKPAGFYEATHVVAAMRRFADKCDEHPPELVAGGLMPSEHEEARALVKKIDAWLDRFIVNLQGRAA